MIVAYRAPAAVQCSLRTCVWPDDCANTKQSKELVPLEIVLRYADLEVVFNRVLGLVPRR